jgi:8-oxo-dGTP diphosphatase
MNGDAWTTCTAGHRHWGRFGAAGLFLLADGAVLLQRRAEWSHHGGTWGVPGGAIAEGESAVRAALREACEEVAGISGSLVQPFSEYVDDHGLWSYTTILARCTHRFAVRPGGPETDAVAWVLLDQVATYDLHPGFAATLSRVRTLIDGGHPDR